MEGKWGEIGETVEYYSEEDDICVWFKKFVLAGYSNELDAALAIVGKSEKGKLHLIATWQPGEGDLREWLDPWIKRLKFIGVWTNKDGAAIENVMKRNRVGTRSSQRLENVSPLEVRLEIPEIDATLYSGWKRTREKLLSKPENALGSAIVLGSRAVRRFSFWD